MKNKYLINLVFLFVFTFTTYCQNKSTDSGGEVVTVQPKIIVIPYVKKGEDIRTLLENDPSKRSIITEIEKNFSDRGFKVSYFSQTLKKIEDNKLLRGNNQTDFKSEIVNYSGADVYVEVDIEIIKSTSGNAVQLNLKAEETSTGGGLSTEMGRSRQSYTEDYSLLASAALEEQNCLTKFLDKMQISFTEIVKNGKSISIDFSLNPSSKINFTTEIKGTVLSYLIEDWMAANSYKNAFNLRASTDLIMIFDEIKIPLKDQSTGRNYSITNFTRILEDYLKSIGVNISKTVKGNQLLISIK